MVTLGCVSSWRRSAVCRHGDAQITFNVHVTLVEEEETSHDLLTYCLQASWVNVQDVSQRWISEATMTMKSERTSGRLVFVVGLIPRVSRAN